MFETPVLNNAVSGKPTVLSMAKQKTNKKKHEIIELHLLVGLAPHFWNHCPKSYLYNKGGLTKNRLIEPNGVQTGFFFLQTALGGSCDVLNINIYSMFL